MKTLLALLACVALALGGCNSTPLTPEQKDNLTAGTLEFVGTAVAPVLAKNPQYAPAVQMLADTLGTLSGDTVITPQLIAEWASATGARLHLSPSDTAWLAWFAGGAWSVYATSTGQQSATLSDPRVQRWVAAFRRGILAGLSAYNAGRTEAEISIAVRASIP